MRSWNEFSEMQPDLAAAGRAQLYQVGIGLGFLSTVRPDGGPRLHPICPVVNDIGLFALIIPGPKRDDLRRDPRYSLHSETAPPPHEDDAFSVSGIAIEQYDPDLWVLIAAQFLAERKSTPFEGFDRQALFELHLDRCLLTLTSRAGRLPGGHTVWRDRH